jgi:hypothetical protein
MGNNHPWKKQITEAVGAKPAGRAKKIYWPHGNVKKVLG